MLYRSLALHRSDQSSGHRPPHAERCADGLEGGNGGGDVQQDSCLVGEKGIIWTCCWDCVFMHLILRGVFVYESAKSKGLLCFLCIIALASSPKIMCRLQVTSPTSLDFESCNCGKTGNPGSCRSPDCIRSIKPKSPPHTSTACHVFNFDPMLGTYCNTDFGEVIHE